MHAPERVKLSRDVSAIVIPDGHAIMLEEGEEVTITQSLGGSYTVLAKGGYVMARVSEENVDALGKEVVLAFTPDENAATDPESVEERAWATMRTVFDPEIPVNIVDLGLIYECLVQPLEEDDNEILVKMTLTAPGCGMGPIIQGDVETKLKKLNGVSRVDVEVVFDPPWSQDMLSEEAKLELGLW